MHGGPTPKGPSSPNYKHGKYSGVYRGLFASAIRGREFLEEQFSLRSELDVSYSMIVSEMERVADAVPAAELWARGRAVLEEAMRRWPGNFSAGAQL